MKDLKKLAQECEKEVRAIGITFENIEYSANYRAKHRFGQCRVTGEKIRINISSFLLEDDVPDKSTKTTIIHEILHAADRNKNGHKGRWREYADRMNKEYGYNIKRTSSWEEKGLESARPQPVTEYKFVFKCLGCGAEIKRQRKSFFTTNTNRFKCNICWGKFVSKKDYDNLSEKQRKLMNEKLSLVAPNPLPRKMLDEILKVK